MQTAFVDGRFLLDEGFRDDCALLVEDGRIAAILPPDAVPPEAGRVSLAGDFLVPGLCDVQVNGGGGVLFNAEPTVDGVARIAAAHRRLGTTSLMPTLISGDLELIDRAMRAVEAAITLGVPGVAGIHLEGPFLNTKRRGAHAEGAVRALDDQAIALLTSLRVGRTLVTLAPETTGGQAIARLAAAGVIVSAGHTDATYEETRAALRHGVRGFTHLFNAMPPLLSRAPGVVGAALENQEAFIGIIVDGLHVSPAVLRLAMRTRPLSRFMLVSDAMPTVGSAATAFFFDGRRVHAAEGACRDEQGALTGSNLSLAVAVRNAVTLLGLSLEDAVAMASSAPAAFLGLTHERGRIARGCVADLLRLNSAGDVVGVWCAGVLEGPEV